MNADMDLAWAFWVGVTVAVILLACDLIRLGGRRGGGRR